MKDRIKDLRKSLNLTQAEFGDKLGLTHSAISKIESGERDPSDSTLKLICATYNVNYQWLTEGREPMYLTSEGDELIARYAPNAMEHMKNAIRTMSTLSDQDWMTLRDLVEDLVAAVEKMRADTPDKA